MNPIVTLMETPKATPHGDPSDDPHCEPNVDPYDDSMVTPMVTLMVVPMMSPMVSPTVSPWLPHGDLHSHLLWLAPSCLEASNRNSLCPICVRLVVFCSLLETETAPGHVWGRICDQ